jgi:uncharacterized protein (UPF0264 family)
MAQLLVSVRSAAEAEAALAGGAALVDVKEPANGPLGRASNATIREVVRTVAGRTPVSAALGEWLDDAAPPADVGALAYLKWGLARAGRRPWRRYARAMRQIVGELHPGAEVVLVAYADWQDAGAPSVDEVADHACQRPGGVLLVDTFTKGPLPWALLHFLTVGYLDRLCRRCHSAGVRVALAGSLGPAEIERLLLAGPDWFAVRGAACLGGRGGQVDAGRVRALVDLLNRPTPAG